MQQKKWWPLTQYFLYYQLVQKGEKRIIGKQKVQTEEYEKY